MKTAVSLQIRDSARPPTFAELEVEPLSLGQRLARGAKRLGLVWAFAIPAILVPPHFVWSALVLLVGVVMGALATRGTVLVTSRSIRCPKCAEETAIEPNRTGWPVGLWCAKCGTTFSASIAARPEGEVQSLNVGVKENAPNAPVAHRE